MNDGKIRCVNGPWNGKFVAHSGQYLRMALRSHGLTVLRADEYPDQTVNGPRDFFAYELIDDYVDDNGVGPVYLWIG